MDKKIIPEEESLKNEIQYENEYSLNLYLPKVNPGLLKMWKGAVETYQSNNFGDCSGHKDYSFSVSAYPIVSL